MSHARRAISANAALCLGGGLAVSSPRLRAKPWYPSGLMTARPAARRRSNRTARVLVGRPTGRRLFFWGLGRARYRVTTLDVFASL